VKIALEEYGHLVLLRLIDVTDDTVLVRKALYNVRCLTLGGSGVIELIFVSLFIYLFGGRTDAFMSSSTCRS
jgi:pumilio family protein 6